MLPEIDNICLQILQYLLRRSDGQNLREKSYVTQAIRKFVSKSLEKHLQENYDTEGYKTMFTFRNEKYVLIEPNLYKDFFMFLMYLLNDLELIKGYYNATKRFYITKKGVKTLKKGNISEFITESISFLENENDDYYRNFVAEIIPFSIQSIQNIETLDNNLPVKDLEKDLLPTQCVQNIDILDTNMQFKNTKNQGYVYIFSNDNPKMKDIIKSGKTQKTPEERAKALNKNTGTIGKYKVEWSRFVENCHLAEKFIHYKLENYHYEKEFFEVDIVKAIEIANRVTKSF